MKKIVESYTMLDHISYLSLVMSFLMLIAALFAGQTSAQDYAAKGVELAQRGQWQEAEAELKRAVKINIHDPAILGTLGGILAMEHRLSEAEPYLEEAVARAPLDRTMRRNLAVNEWQLGKLREARFNLEKIIESDHGDRKAILFLGMVAENQHKYSEAARLLGSVPELIREEPTAILAFAAALYALGSQQEARAQLATVPPSEEFIFSAAQTATEAGDWEKSLELLRPLTRQNPGPDKVQALGARDVAAILMETGKFREALAVATDASQRFSWSPELLALKGAAATRLGYFLEAAAAFQQACRLQPDSAAFRRGWAAAQWKAGTRAEAMRNFDQLLRQFPGDPLNYEIYGTLLVDSGDGVDVAKGVALLREALTLNPASSAANLYLGNLALGSGRNEEARRRYEAGLAHDTANAKLHFALSRALRRLGRVAESEKELENYQRLAH